jgi:hypothetical protein
MVKRLYGASRKTRDLLLILVSLVVKFYSHVSGLAFAWFAVEPLPSSTQPLAAIRDPP